MLDILVSRIKAAVEAGGGRFVTVWEILDQRLVLFDSPQTGTTLALPVADVLEDGYGADNVRDAIKESDAKFDT